MLDLFSCAGGAGRGYERAGFDVFSVDVERQKNNPYPFHLGDAIDVMDRLLAGERIDFTSRDRTVVHLGLRDFRAAHMSPPCQPFSVTKHSHTNTHPDLLVPARAGMQAEPASAGVDSQLDRS